jgi:RimJ/RimL family protein N-acetyltransferase
MSEISIRTASPDDMQMLFDWRNDPLTKSMSLNAKAIELSEHRDWFNAALLRDSCLILIAELLGKSSLETEQIGMVRFEIANKQSTISINLNPRQRGKGFAALCLKEAIEFYKEKYESCERILAQIKAGNVASQKSFMRAGFLLASESDDGTVLQYQLALVNNR